MQSVTLIIDKRKELSTKYKKLLQSKENTVIIGKNLIASLKLIQDLEPDLIIISDSINDSLAGFCKKIRALTYNMRPVIVAISKSAELTDRLEALENGADDFISEPVNPDEFVMRMKAHLRREYESNFDVNNFLPDKKYSLRALKRVLAQNDGRACMLASIENYENYKETYTKLASDKMLKTYIAIIRSALSEDDYLGLISENKFLIITDGIKAERVANYLVFAFDSVAAKFYSPQDNKRGYMLMQGDEFAGRRSNFVHTTIGIVTNEFINYYDTASLLNALIEIHDMAEYHNKSNYLIERPKISAQNSVATPDFNKNIFIIEQDESMSILLKTILNLQGYEVECGENYNDINGEKTFAVIIIDAGSEENPAGIEFCRKLRENPDFNGTKIIVTSVFHEKELILDAGADLYIPKPYDISNIVKWADLFVKEFNRF